MRTPHMVYNTYSNFHDGEGLELPGTLFFLHCVKRLFKRFFLNSSDCRLLNEGVDRGDTEERGLEGDSHSMLASLKCLFLKKTCTIFCATDSCRDVKFKVKWPTWLQVQLQWLQLQLVFIRTRVTYWELRSEKTAYFSYGATISQGGGEGRGRKPLSLARSLTCSA